MRRAASALGLLAVVAGWLALTGAGSGAGGSGYRVDAIFDNASFLIPGQDVKIAGAKVGTVTDVKLTPDHKARIELDISKDFAPFRSDADCTIQPQSLIGEKFIQCTPGTPKGHALTGDPPTVPLRNTHSPVDLDLVMATFRFPTNQRLALLLDELGAGFAARGDDLNDAIRRAAPALEQTRRVLRIVSDDRRTLRALIGSSEHVLGTLADHRQDVSAFVDRSAKVLTRTAEHRADIGQATARLPGLLAEARPALRDLKTLARDGTPILRDLQAAAPQLDELAQRAGPLADAARPALSRIGDAAKTGGPVLRRAGPIVRDLRTFAGTARPTGVLVDQLFQSLRQRGVVEGLQSFVYFAALATSRYDRYSHILPAHLITNACSQYATKTVAGCSANFAGGGARGAAKRKRVARVRAKRGRPAHQRRRAEPSEPAPSATPSEQPPAPPKPQIQVPGLPPIQLPPLPNLPSTPATKRLLDYLLR